MDRPRKNFIKVDENFRCVVCGNWVNGSGYTNHCTKCLSSLHVDKEVPGDRLSNCLGIMDPVGVFIKRGKWYIIHVCRKCGKKMANKVSIHDDFDMVIRLSVSSWQQTIEV